MYDYVYFTDGLLTDWTSKNLPSTNNGLSIEIKTKDNSS